MANTGGTLYLNIIWHQHQPLYLNPESDQLEAPWVRTHGTKDYYDMASVLEQYPDVHCTFNLTSSLLMQIEEYYVRRLKPFVDHTNNRVRSEKFFAKWKGNTDPWIDLALKPTSTFDERDKNFLLYDTWNALYVSDVMLARFPEYKLLKEKALRKESLSEQELREIKFWFFLAYFDPDFLEGKQKLADGSAIDLTDCISKHHDGVYRLKKIISEDDCNRIIAEMYKVLSNIIPIHKKLMYNWKTKKGQIDIATTPFYHPILPLIYDSELARECQPGQEMPRRFHFPQDAEAQVIKAVRYFKTTFGQSPNGMWPAEGSVAQEIISLFGENGIRWIATDEKILFRSQPSHQPLYYPYCVGDDHPVAVVFRDTGLSDKIGFTYQSWKGVDAANDFVHHILNNAPQANEQDRLLTVILDGENAWEWYRQDNDGKEFLHSLYGKLRECYRSRSVVTVTMSEYIHGNPARNIPAHPVAEMKKLDRLFPGSWINANYDTWIGNPQKNRAWEYLRTARTDLGSSGITSPKLTVRTPRPGTTSWYAYKAWEEMYAAEGSDWFWWYGTQQYVPGGTLPFDVAFIKHLNNIYAFARSAGGTMPERNFSSITGNSASHEGFHQGTMKQSAADIAKGS
jgi:alpha-amylase/alpha-mannosidase (GH57 family)